MAKSQKTRKTKSRSYPLYTWLMPLCMALYGFLYLNYGEIIAVNQGCGWDGNWFRDCAAYGPQQFTNKQLSPYRVQRILPSMIVHYSSYYALLLMQRFGMTMPKTATEAIVATFQVYNLLLLISAAYLWAMIARYLLLKSIVAWLGFVLLFGSFAIMKYSFYYPPLTDTSAFFISILMLYAYILNRSWLLLLAIAFGFWTWQTTVFVGIILYLFPKEDPKSSDKEEALLAPKTYRIIAVAFGIMLAVIAWLAILQELNFTTTAEKPTVPLVYFSITTLIVYGAYTFFFTSKLLPLSSLKQAFQQQSTAIRLGGVGIILVVLYGLKYFAQNSDLRSEMELALFIGGTFSAAVAKPLLGVVANTVFFGPPLLLALLLLPRLTPHIRRLGLGYIAIFSLTILLCGIMTESRQLSNMMPFLVAPCCLWLQSVRAQTSVYAMLMIGSLAWSQAYLTLNVPQMQELSGVMSAYSQFPMQTYFRFHGPWMGIEAYIWTALAAIATCGVLILLLQPHIKFNRGDFQ